MSKLLINEYPLQVLPSLAVAIGLQEAIVLQQIHYWTIGKPAESDGRAWVFNSFEDWSATNFPFWSAEACRKIFKSLRDKNLILVKPRGLHAFDKVQKYAVDYAALAAIEVGITGKACPHHAVKNSASERENIPPLYTETSSETTAEKKTGAVAPTPKTPRKKKEDTTLQDWIDALPEDELAIREDDPLYQDGIPVEMLTLAWAVFKERHATSGKKYTDWRAAFRDCVRRDYLKLWAIDREGTYYLTTAGKQAAQRLGMK